jgi:hypothetical protein
MTGKKVGFITAIKVGGSIGVDFKKIEVFEFKKGLNKELVSNGNRDITEIGRDVLLHLKEDGHYYSNLEKVRKGK